jgi:DHA2 family multidrug resistance protein-like MFS transporter
MAVIDSSIANIALPTIARDLGASAASSVWVVNSYQIAITMTLLPAAALGEKLGYRRVYLAGLALFVAASLGCAISRDLTTLALARFVQGFGAAAIMSINAALVRFTYPKAQLGRGVGYNALVVAMSAAAGPTVAAGILSVAPWPWLFAVNLPTGFLALAIGLRCLPATPRAQRPFDLVSTLLNAAAFGAIFLAFSDFAHGAFSIVAVSAAIVGVVAGVALVCRSRHQVAPLVPLDLLRVPLLRLSYASSAGSFAAQMIAFIALPFYLQGRFHFDHVATGLLITPWPLAVVVTAPIAGRLVERFPAGLLGGIGMAILAVGLCLLAELPPDPSSLTIVLRMVLCGVGFGLFQTPNNRTMIVAAPRERSGAAGGMQAISRLVGQTTGATIVVLVFRLVTPMTVLPLLVAAALAAAAALSSLQRLTVDHRLSGGAS